MDSTDRKRAEEELNHQAFHDALTGLPNRRLLMDRLHQSMAGSARSGQYGAVMMLDLDNFKDLNDSQGHDIGDHLLIQVGKRLRENIRQADTISRVGGDEFVVILSELDDLESIDRIAQDLVDKLASSFKLGPDEVYVPASIGISLYPEDTGDLEELFKNADQAMYAAKAGGRNRFN